MKRLPIWPPQPSYWATRCLLVRLGCQTSWLLSIRNDCQSSSNDSRDRVRALHSMGVSHHQLLNSGLHFLPDLVIKPRTRRSSVVLAATRPTGQSNHDTKCCKNYCWEMTFFCYGKLLYYSNAQCNVRKHCANGCIYAYLKISWYLKFSYNI